MRSIDNICDLIEEAHGIFNDIYDNPGTEKIDRYLEAIEKLKGV